MKISHLEWIYASEMFLNVNFEIISSPACKIDIECLKLYLHLSKFLEGSAQEYQQRIPPGKHLIPKIVVYWNRNKGSVDILSIFLKDVKITFRKASPRVIFCVRMIFILTYNRFTAYKLHKKLKMILIITNYQVFKKILSRELSFYFFCKIWVVIFMFYIANKITL